MTVADIIARLGGASEAALHLGVKRTTLLQWRARGQVPARHVWRVAGVLRVPPETIRPDLATAPHPRLEAA